MSTFIKMVFGLLIGCAAVWAQGSIAQINGTVRDASGLAVPGADVKATQTATGTTRTATSGADGAYIFTNLPIGPYRLEVSKEGFTQYLQSGIVLQVDSNPTVDVALKVGAVTEQVQVEADAALVETRNVGIGQVIDNTRVLEMPLNGRQVTDLILLSGAAVGGGALQSNRNYPTTAISVGGGINNGLSYLLDGGTHNDPYNDLNLPLPFPDALQEFKVETNALPAQYGQHSAGVINVVTKSGTNEYHGDAFEFVRNSYFNARNAFALKRDSLKRNQFGGVLGGPAKKNKLFFFGGYQGTTQRSAPSTAFAHIPTPAALAGDFTALASPACNSGRQITLKAPFANNQISPSLFSTPSMNFVSLKTFPTTSDSCGQIQFGHKSNSNERIIVGKVDYQWSAKHSLFGRYEFAQLTLPTDYDGVNLLTLSGADYIHRAQSFVLGDTYLIGSSTVSSFRATLDRAANPKTFRDLFTWSDLGVKDFYYPSSLPKMALLSVAGGFVFNSQQVTPGNTASTIFQFADDLSLVRGTHQIGFGVNYIHDGMNILANTTVPGQANFTASNTGMGLGDFMVGRLATWTQQQQVAWYMRHHYVGLYLQDTWKATSRLTISGGLRWEPYLAPFEKNGEIVYFSKAAFDQGLQSTVYKNAPAGLQFAGDPGIPISKSYGTNHLAHFGPRLGLVWDPKGDGRMTVRAAYGLFFDYQHLFQFDGQKDTPPWGSRAVLTNPPGGFVNPWQGYPGGDPFPVDAHNPNVTFPASGAYLAIPLDFKTTYIHQWNLSLERQVGKDWLVSGNYIGNSLIHLINGSEIDPAVYFPGASCVIYGQTFTPCSSTNNTIQRRALYLENPVQGQYYGHIAVANDGGTRNYNALLISVLRRRSRGVTLQANYTWSHCIDDGTATGIVDAGATADRRRLNRGNCELDRRHNFSMSTVYATPEFSNRAVRALGSGWRASAIVRILSGPYLTILSGLDNALTATTDERPNQILASPYAPTKSTQLWLNPAAFVQPAIGTYGNLGAMNIVGPGSITIDAGLTRTFQVREKKTLEFRFEAFNLPNHVNPGKPDLTLTDNIFGIIQSAADPRIMQIALKFVF